MTATALTGTCAQCKRAFDPTRGYFSPPDLCSVTCRDAYLAPSPRKVRHLEAVDARVECPLCPESARKVQRFSQRELVLHLERAVLDAVSRSGDPHRPSNAAAYLAHLVVLRACVYPDDYDKGPAEVRP